MKIRSDFVTNSSSSSFIIGKKDDETVTLESVFQTIKGFYKEYLDKKDAVVKYITDNPNLGMVYQEAEDGTYYYFKILKENRCNDKNHDIVKSIERNFGISIYDWFGKDYEWLNCETYKDYETYWLNKMCDTDDYRVHAPFTITDFLEEKEINWLHFKEDEKEKEPYFINSKSDILGWYDNYAEEAFANMNCETCWNKDNCDRVNCITILEEYKDIPEDKACLYLLGRVCIHSECGYIPEYVVEKLSNISEFSCNHMG